MADDFSIEEMILQMRVRAEAARDAQLLVAKGPPVDPTAALAVLQNAPSPCYLGGSRRMKELECADPNYRLSDGSLFDIHPWTDYDYFATFTHELYEYLQLNQFEETDFSAKTNSGLVTGYDLDTEAVAIMQRDNVQIVLRQDADFYKKVFDNIPLEFYHEFLWKSSPTNPSRENIQPIFNALFSVAHAIKGV